MTGSGAGGDRRARYEALFRLAFEPVQRFVRRRAPAALVDDVVADTMLVMWRRLDDIPDDAALAWCYGVARGCLANALRGSQRQHRLALRLAREPVTAVAPAADDPDLTAALSRLREDDRELLRLWAWEQLPPREIAAVLGLTPNAVSIRLHRLTRKLRADLDRKEDGAAGQSPSRPRRRVAR